MITLKPGDKAPSFTARDQDGKKVSLSDFKGKKLVLYFFPEANSPTCTEESCSLSDHYSRFKKAGVDVLGVCPDPPEAAREFVKRHKFPFSIIPDTEHEVMSKYGTWDWKKLFGHEFMGVLRTTFLIDEKGVVIRVFTRPRNKIHAQEIEKALA